MEEPKISRYLNSSFGKFKEEIITSELESPFGDKSPEAHHFLNLDSYITTLRL